MGSKVHCNDLFAATCGGNIRVVMRIKDKKLTFPLLHSCSACINDVWQQSHFFCECKQGQQKRGGKEIFELVRAIQNIGT